MNNNDQENSKTLTKAKIEWNRSMEAKGSLNLADDPFNKYTTKGRCKRCWGGLIGRSNEAYLATGIKCLVCGKILEGSDAEAEEKRMSDEKGRNLMNMLFGGEAKYGDGAFAYKIFPHVGRFTEEEIRKRIRSKMTAGGGLTRNQFPAGTPGFLYLQATLLMAGLGQTISQVERERSVLDFPEVKMKDDGAAAVSLPVENLGKNTQHQNFELMGRLGSTMSYAMFSAFACELAMKAISLTCKDEAAKSHDLLDLFNDLPDESRGRLKADYPEIEEVMDQQRHTFGKWRYFETAVGGQGIKSMAATASARALGKAARVILDEAAFVGLSGKVKVDGKETVKFVGQRKNYDYRYELTITGSESPPRV